MFSGLFLALLKKGSRSGFFVADSVGIDIYVRNKLNAQNQSFPTWVALGCRSFSGELHVPETFVKEPYKSVLERERRRRMRIVKAGGGSGRILSAGYCFAWVAGTGIVRGAEGEARLGGVTGPTS